MTFDVSPKAPPYFSVQYLLDVMSGTGFVFVTTWSWKAEAQHDGDAKVKARVEQLGSP